MQNGCNHILSVLSFTKRGSANVCANFSIYTNHNHQNKIKWTTRDLCSSQTISTYTNKCDSQQTLFLLISSFFSIFCFFEKYALRIRIKRWLVTVIFGCMSLMCRNVFSEINLSKCCFVNGFAFLLFLSFLFIYLFI